MKFSLIFAALVFSNATLAQTAVTPKEQIPVTQEKILGWSKTANLGVNISFSSSEDVVGQTDGNSETYGANLKGGWNHMSEDAEWRNSLSLAETTTKTPAIRRYVKSNDELKLESIYLYSLPNLPQIGPYAKAEVSTAIFKGEDVQAANVTYAITNNDGSIQAPTTASTLRLTDGFKPLTTKESVGFFWKAKEEADLKLLFRLGFGATQVQADGQYAVTGKDAVTGNILVTELSDLNQAGLEAGASIKGKIDEKSAYEAGVEALVPFINNKRSGDDRDALRLTNIDAFAKLTSNITSWASFGYDYKMKLQPQLVDRVQTIHMLVLSANYNLF